MPQAEDRHRGTLRIQGINTNGCINRRHLLMNEINSNKGKNIIYVINDIRLQHGEENRLQLINHNATIHNLPLQNHRPGGCAILTPKGIHITVHNNYTKESILMSFNVNNNQRITLATQYVHGSGAKIDRALVDDFARISRDHIGIMVGDFNSPLKIFGSHVYVDVYLFE